MSFILDALKKSETERQRADAPALYEAKLAPPRRGMATWLIVLAGLLLINIAVLSVVLLRGSHGAAPAAEAVNPPQVPAAAAPAPVVSSPVVPAPTPAQAQALPPPSAAPATPEVPGADTAAAGDPADDQPALDARHASPGAPAPAPVGRTADLPTYDQAASMPGANLPELKLDLHAYASNPAERFVFLNMTKLREGQSSPQGVRVESITPEGAILSWQGNRFFLQRQ